VEKQAGWTWNQKLHFKKISANATKPNEVGGNHVFPIIAGAVIKEGKSIPKSLINTMLDFGKKGYTHGTIIPLHIDYSDKMDVGIVPIDLMMRELEKARFIAILNTCICRTSFDCKEHPKDLGCIFLNAAGEQVVGIGLARQATVEEAKQHILWARKEGLMGCAEFVQGEQLVWGLKNTTMHEFRMFCFCCSCCCLALKVLKGGNEETRARYVSCGYTSTINHLKCVGCHSCATVCPQGAISYRKDIKAVVNQETCMGCGWCTLECKNDAICVKQTFPMRKTLNEYFLKEARIDDRSEH